MANLDTVRLKESGEIIGELLTCEEPVCGLQSPLEVAVRPTPENVNAPFILDRKMVGCESCQTLQLIAIIES